MFWLRRQRTPCEPVELRFDVKSGIDSFGQIGSRAQDGVWFVASPWDGESIFSYPGSSCDGSCEGHEGLAGQFGLQWPLSKLDEAFQ